MTKHNKETVIREYCLARQIPYAIKGDGLYINGVCQMYNIYNIPWAELIQTINKNVQFDSITGYFKSFSPSYAYNGNNL